MKGRLGLGRGEMAVVKSKRGGREKRAKKVVKMFQSRPHSFAPAGRDGEFCMNCCPKSVTGGGVEKWFFSPGSGFQPLRSYIIPAMGEGMPPAPTIEPVRLEVACRGGKENKTVVGRRGINGAYRHLREASQRVGHPINYQILGSGGRPSTLGWLVLLHGA